jgi:HrpA-like RNA helicase
MSELPVKYYSTSSTYAEKEILYAIEKHDIVMISAETGSGKTTRTAWLT